MIGLPALSRNSYSRGNLIVKPVLGITLGEAAGIGPELIAKLCANDRLTQYCQPVLIGDVRVLEAGQKTAKVSFPFQVVDNIDKVVWEGPITIVDLKNLDPATVEVATVNAASGRVTEETLLFGLELLKQKKIDGLVFAPLNKEAMKRGGMKFEDEHRLFAHQLDWNKPFGEINVLDKLWTTRVTSHIPLSEVASKLTTDNILRAVALAHQTLNRAGYEKPRIAVAAINPHAGEGGLCGREEIDVIGPAVKTACSQGLDVVGPFSADTVFINAFAGHYDAVVTMYHDQGQIAMKLMGFQFGVTVAGGLPYAITTPAHGTAFDIAGKGVAKTDATEKAVMIAAKMAGWRG
ncbi:MAG: 4-hydroxythreonine-4-phosphate dehydrogenase PdxA [Negativicutes bacterium]|nr:4-hydroxythreonine-4-phosphate dehydrogenase PdxA [Negativicutes bacterium]